MQCKCRSSYGLSFFYCCQEFQSRVGFLKQRKKVYLRLAATRDEGDGPTFLAMGSNHYMNVFGDAPWEVDGRETNADTFFCN